MSKPENESSLHRPNEAGRAPEDAENHIKSQVRTYLTDKIAKDTANETRQVIVGTALLPKGQKRADILAPDLQKAIGPGKNQLVLIPAAADLSDEPMKTMDGDAPLPPPCADARYLDGKFYIADSGCVTTPFHGITVYLGKPSDDGVDSDNDETVISFPPDADGEMELQAGGVLWVQDFRLEKPTLATITLEGSKNTAWVQPSKHVGIIFGSPDEASVYSAMGDTSVVSSSDWKPEIVHPGDMKIFKLNRDVENTRANVSCNVSQDKQQVSHTHIPREILENFLVISFVVILTVTRKMGTVTRHSERPRKE